MALVLIDAEPRRQRERQLYAACCRALDGAVRRLKAFETREKPAFQIWVEVEFTAELTELRQAEAAVRELTELIVDVERYAEGHSISYATAYQRLLAAKAAGTEEALWQQPRPEAKQAASGPQEGEDWAQAFARDFAKAFADALDDFEGSPVSGPRDAPTPPREAPEGQTTESADAYFKSLYRQLVRLLHPDFNPGADQSLWHEVQEAYAWGDLQKLQSLHKQVSGAAAISVERASIGDLIALRQALEAKLKQMRSSLEAARRHPAWKHAKAVADPELLDGMREEIAEMIAGDFKDAKRELGKLEAWIAGWKGPGKRNVKAKGRKKAG